MGRDGLVNRSGRFIIGFAAGYSGLRDEGGVGELGAYEFVYIRGNEIMRLYLYLSIYHYYF